MKYRSFKFFEPFERRYLDDNLIKIMKKKFQLSITINMNSTLS